MWDREVRTPGRLETSTTDVPVFSCSAVGDRTPVVDTTSSVLDSHLHRRILPLTGRSTWAMTTIGLKGREGRETDSRPGIEEGPEPSPVHTPGVPYIRQTLPSPFSFPTSSTDGKLIRLPETEYPGTGGVTPVPPHLPLDDPTIFLE